MEPTRPDRHRDRSPSERRRTTWTKALAIIAVLAMILAACGEDDTTDTTAPSDDGATTTAPSDDGATTTAPSDDGGDMEDDTLTVGLRADLNAVDIMRRGSIGDIGVLLNIFGEHAQRNNDGTLSPGLLESWEANDDATVWTMTLREGLTFHNGDPVTAEDLAFSVMRAATIDEDITAYWNLVESAEPIDDLTVEVTLSEPNPLQMRSGELGIQPKAYFEEVGEQAYQEAPIGAGPYKFVEWRPGDRLVLEAFEDYWDGEAPIKNVIFRIFPDDAARTAAFRAGELDIAEYIPIEEFIQMAEDPSIGTASVYGAPRNWIVIDTHKAPMDDVRVRRALNHAIDWDLIIETIMGGYALRTRSMAVPQEISYTEDIPFYSYDPDLARELLAEAGYPDGVDIDFTVRLGYPKAEEVSVAIQQMLTEVGLRATLNQVANADYGNLAREKNIGNIAFSGYVGDGSYVGHAFHDGRMVCDGGESSTHGGFYCSDAILELLEETFQYFITDFPRAEAALEQMEQIIWEDAAGGFGYQRPNLYGVNPDLDWEPSPFLYLLMQKASWK